MRSLKAMESEACIELLCIAELWVSKRTYSYVEPQVAWKELQALLHLRVAGAVGRPRQ